MTFAYADADQILHALPPAEAVEILRRTLTDGYDPAQDAPRQALDLPQGQLLIMPSATAEAAGVKVLTVAPEDPERTLPRVQGQYLLFDGRTLTPRMVLDGEALTSLRTPAVSLAGVRHLLTDSPEAIAGEPLEVVIFGTGPQGLAHAQTVREVLREVREVSVTFISRSEPENIGSWCASGSAEASAALAQAGLVLCCTTAAEPIVDRDDLRPDAVVVAVGSHSPEARELGSRLMSAARVVVEDVQTALREAGDVIQAIDQEALRAEDLIPMREAVCGSGRGAGEEDGRLRPTVFKTTGMSWQDLVLAHEIAQRLG